MSHCDQDVESRLELLEELIWLARSPQRSGALPPLNGSWSQSQWFIDGQNVSGAASDRNAGSSAGKPVATFTNGVLARWNSYTPLLGQATTITWLSDGQPTDQVIITPRLLANVGSITLTGTPTLIASGTLGTVVPKNRSTPQLLTANLGVDPTPWIGLRLYNVTRNAWCWIDGVVASSAVLTQPLAPLVGPLLSPEVAYPPAMVDSFASGDTYQIWRPTQVQLNDFRPVSYNLQQPSLNMPAAWQNIWVPSFPIGSGITRVSNSIAFGVMNRVDRQLQIAFEGETQESGAGALNCWLNGSVNMDATVNGIRFIGGAVATQNPGGSMNGSGIWDADVILHGFDANLPYGSVFGSVYIDNLFAVAARILRIEPADYTTGCLWGPGSMLLLAGSTVRYAGLAVNALLLKGGITINGNTTASAYDESVDPALWHARRTITAAHLDASIASGGFAGAAIDPTVNASIASETRT
jgi:hypothetical protein